MNLTKITINLNKQQQQAVILANNINALILAGAGSGKTKVLIHRIAYLIDNYNLDISNILALTFTNKAAKEISIRLTELLRMPINQSSWVGTFHGIAHKLLRIHFTEAKLKNNFQIIDSSDQLRIIKRILKEQNIDDKRFPAKQIANFINSNKDEGLRINDIDAGYNLFVKKAIEVFTIYENYCNNEDLIDFAEILIRCYELLKNNSSILIRYQQQFKHILIDEFQDTNKIQYNIIKLFKNTDNVVFCVGDDDQSIYGWRGARIENIKKLTTDFQPLTTIKLEQNYRSTSNILNASNAIIANNSERIGKNLWTSGSDGDLINIYQAESEKQEALFIAKQIKELLASGTNLNQCAVLYRSNALSRSIEDSFIKNKLNYTIYGGLRFFDREEVKHAMCYLRLVLNHNDNIAFERIVNFPTRGIGNNTITVINQFAISNNTSLFSASKEVMPNLPARASNALNKFIIMIEKLTDKTKNIDLSEKLQLIINDSDLLNYYKNSNHDKAGSKAQNIEELIGAAKEFNNEDTTISDTEAFIAMASLDGGEIKYYQDSVQLMTIHSAKGLEFDNVFVIGLEEDLFPSKQSKEEQHLINEERRLCYVAMTRARKKLTLSYAKKRFLYGNTFYTLISRFIKEIPNKYTNNISFNIDNFLHTNNNYQKQEIPNTTFNIGENVLHQKFGVGVVMNFEDIGENSRIEVNFKTAGTKWLIVAYANLEKVS